MAKVAPEELEFQSRLEMAVLESLVSLPIEDLNRWNFRARAFANLDAHISRATADEQPCMERLFLLLVVWKCLNRLLEPTKSAVKRELSPTEKLYRQQQQAKAAPVKRAVGRPLGRKGREYSGEYARRLAKMGPEKAAEFKAREAARIRDRRARAKLVPGS
jgi:hypothetical protein